MRLSQCNLYRGRRSCSISVFCICQSSRTGHIAVQWLPNGGGQYLQVCSRLACKYWASRDMFFCLSVCGKSASRQGSSLPPGGCGFQVPNTGRATFRGAKDGPDITSIGVRLSERSSSDVPCTCVQARTSHDLTASTYSSTT